MSAAGQHQRADEYKRSSQARIDFVASTRSQAIHHASGSDCGERHSAVFAVDARIPLGRPTTVQGEISPTPRPDGPCS
jgi:hypothetical protein